MSYLNRTERLVGSAAIRRLAQSRVGVFGLGGVGGAAAEALARSGIGSLDLIDDDRIAESNLNRQILALRSTTGRYKADVAAERLRDINPDISLHLYRMFYLPETARQIPLSDFDYLIDAMDTVTAKLSLIEFAQAEHIPIISCMGTGNRLDPSALRVGDIYSTCGDPLSRVMRRELRKRGIRSLQVVYSLEMPLVPSPSKEQTPEPSDTRPSPSRKDVPGSAAFVPPAAGFLAASAVVRALISGPNGSASA